MDDFHRRSGVGLLLNILIHSYLFAGVCGAHPLWFLPCKFMDEHVFLNAENHTETQLIHRNSMLQLGEKGDAPVNPQAITFLATGARLDLRHYLEGVNPYDLECEMRRYSTEGIHVRWPVQEPQEHNRWYKCILTHAEGLVSAMVFLRQPSDQVPSGQDFRKWPVINDGEILTTAVTMVMKTQTPTVRASLGSQQNLHCQFALDHKKPDATVEWQWQHRGEKKTLFSHNTRTGRTQGSGVATRSLAAGDVTYTIAFTKMIQEGTFACSVSVMPLFGNLDIQLHIAEPPRVSINVGPTLVLVEGGEQKVICEAASYYPLDVDIVWYQHDPASVGQRVGAQLPKPLQNILLSSHKHNSDKTYTLSAFFYLTASLQQSGRQFTCSVSHSSLRVPIKKNFILTVEEPSSLPFYLGVGIVLLLLLVVLCVMLPSLVTVRRRSVQKKPY